MKKRILGILSLVFCLGLMAACGKDDSHVRSLSEIKESGKVVIGVFSDKKPFGYVDANGDYQGYDVYFGNRLAKDLGVEVEYVPVEAASRVEYLLSNKVDIILANFTVTEERAEKVNFTLPYMKVALGVVSPDRALITDVSQLANKTLIVSKGTTAETYFTQNHPEVNLLKFDQYTEAYGALLDGRGDALSTDNTAVNKDNKELLDWISDEIKALGEEQFFHEAYEQTLAPVYGEAADVDNLVIEGGVLED